MSRGLVSHPYLDTHALTLLLGEESLLPADEVMGFQGLCLEPGAENLGGGGWEGWEGARGSVRSQGQEQPGLMALPASHLAH